MPYFNENAEKTGTADFSSISRRTLSEEEKRGKDDESHRHRTPAMNAPPPPLPNRWRAPVTGDARSRACHVASLKRRRRRRSLGRALRVGVLEVRVRNDRLPAPFSPAILLAFLAWASGGGEGCQLRRSAGALGGSSSATR